MSNGINDGAVDDVERNWVVVDCATEQTTGVHGYAHLVSYDDGNLIEW